MILWFSPSLQIINPTWLLLLVITTLTFSPTLALLSKFSVGKLTKDKDFTSNSERRKIRIKECTKKMNDLRKIKSENMVILSSMAELRNQRIIKIDDKPSNVDGMWSPSTASFPERECIFLHPFRRKAFCYSLTSLGNKTSGKLSGVQFSSIGSQISQLSKVFYLHHPVKPVVLITGHKESVKVFKNFITKYFSKTRIKRFSVPLIWSKQQPH